MSEWTPAKKGTYGVRNARSKLNPDLVLEIRDGVKHGVSYAALGRMYNVNWQTIRDVALNRSWRGVKSL